MKKSILAVVVLAVVAAGGYYFSMQPVTNVSNNYYQSDAAGGDGYADPVVSQPVSGGAQGVVLNTATSASLGTFLVDANGMTLYHFANDMPGVSTCTGPCATLWPAYIVTSATSLQVGAGINGKIATITRSDGSMQITYDDQPLYYWHGDTMPGDTFGQGIGGVWFVVKP